MGSGKFFCFAERRDGVGNVNSPKVQGQTVSGAAR